MPNLGCEQMWVELKCFIGVTSKTRELSLDSCWQMVIPCHQMGMMNDLLQQNTPKPQCFQSWSSHRRYLVPYLGVMSDTKVLLAWKTRAVIHHAPYSQLGLKSRVMGKHLAQVEGCLTLVCAEWWMEATTLHMAGFFRLFFSHSQT